MSGVPGAGPTPPEPPTGRPGGRPVEVHHRPRHLVAWVLVAAALGSVATAVAVGVGVAEVEVDVLRWVAGWPDVVEAVLWPPMQAGSLVAPFVVAAAAWWAWRAWRPAVGALVVGVGGWWLAKGVKAVVDRGRPVDEVVGFVPRGSAPADGLGFLSGHATVAAGLATVVWPWLGRRGRVAVATLVVVVAVARVYVGAHLPLDVVGGACLGVLLGCGWHLAVGVPDRRRAAWGPAPPAGPPPGGGGAG